MNERPLMISVLLLNERSLDQLQVLDALRSELTKTIGPNRAYRNEEEGADPVGPLASTEGGPIGARLVEGLLVGGLRLVPDDEGPRIVPAPIAAPAEGDGGKLAAG